MGKEPGVVPRVAKELGVVSFFNDFASEMVYPLLPALMTQRLGSGALALGVLDGVAEAVSSSVKLAAGWLAERLRWRRPLVVGGYGVPAVSRPLMGLAGAAWQVVVLRGVDRLGKGARTPPRDTIIADATAPAARGRAFGYNRALDHAGAVVGPVVAWALMSRTSAKPEEVIVASAVPGVLAALLVVWATRHVGRSAPARLGREVVTPESAPASVPRARLMFGLIVAFAFARLPETLFLLRLQDLGVAVAVIPLLWAAMHVVRSTASYPGGWINDRLGSGPTMLIGWAVYAAVCGGLAVSGKAHVAVVWFLVFGLVAAGTEAPERAFVAAAARARYRGRGFGVYHASVGLAALPGALALGWLYQTVGATWALAASGVGVALLTGGGAVAMARRAQGVESR